MSALLLDIRAKQRRAFIVRFTDLAKSWGRLNQPMRRRGAK